MINLSEMPESEAKEHLTTAKALLTELVRSLSYILVDKCEGAEDCITPEEKSELLDQYFLLVRIYNEMTDSVDNTEENPSP